MTLTLLEITSLVLLGSAVFLSLLRLLLGPTTPDRVVAADTLAVMTTSGLVVLAALLGSALYLDVALIYGTLAFVGVVAIARAIEGNGS
ncbi:MAG: monovalent cation/H+ antiporter complex subunit F [Candidatus Thiodiazotropha sp.]|jgi:multisubunit Na+/H+ antiporter MnhF subunit